MEVRYEFNLSNISTIPGYIFGYWASLQQIKSFKEGLPIEQLGNAKQGIIPGNVDEFVREWFEVRLNDIGFNHTTDSDILKYGKKWFPYNKGGAFRRWYGNLENLINMKNNGYDIKFSGKNNNFRLREPSLYFKECVSWSKISSGILSMRFVPKGTLFDIAGCCIFDLNNREFYILALVNSKVVLSLMQFIAPTLNFEVDQIKKIPVIFNKDKEEQINAFTKNNIDICKIDWDSFETSWDFKKHPLI